MSIGTSLPTPIDLGAAPLGKYFLEYLDMENLGQVVGDGVESLGLRGFEHIYGTFLSSRLDMENLGQVVRDSVKGFGLGGFNHIYGISLRGLLCHVRLACSALGQEFRGKPPRT